MNELSISYSPGSEHGSILNGSMYPAPGGACTVRRGHTVTIAMDVEIGGLLTLSL